MKAYNQQQGQVNAASGLMSNGGVLGSIVNSFSKRREYETRYAYNTALIDYQANADKDLIMHKTAASLTESIATAGVQHRYDKLLADAKNKNAMDLDTHKTKNVKDIKSHDVDSETRLKEANANAEVQKLKDITAGYKDESIHPIAGQAYGNKITEDMIWDSKGGRRNNTSENTEDTKNTENTKNTEDSENGRNKSFRTGSTEHYNAVNQALGEGKITMEEAAFASPQHKRRFKDIIKNAPDSDYEISKVHKNAGLKPENKTKIAPDEQPSSKVDSAEEATITSSKKSRKNKNDIGGVA